MQPRQHSAFGEKAVANELGKAEDETAQKLILAGMEFEVASGASLAAAQQAIIDFESVA